MAVVRYEGCTVLRVLPWATEQLFSGFLCSPQSGEGSGKGDLKKIALKLLGQQTAVGKSPLFCGRKTRKICKITPITVGAWNVRTLLDRNRAKRPERRTALIARELKKPPHRCPQQNTSRWQGKPLRAVSRLHFLLVRAKT